MLSLEALTCEAGGFRLSADLAVAPGRTVAVIGFPAFLKESSVGLMLSVASLAKTSGGMEITESASLLSPRLRSRAFSISAS